MEQVPNGHFMTAAGKSGESEFAFGIL